MLKYRPTFIEPIKALAVPDDPILDSPSKHLTIRSGSEYLATDMIRRNYEIPMNLDLEAISESPEKLTLRRASSPTKRKTLPSNALIIDEVKPCRREKEKIKSELLDEWKKEKIYVDKYLSSTRCKLKVSNKKHPLNRLRKIAYSIIWMNKLHRPAVKKIDDPVVYSQKRPLSTRSLKIGIYARLSKISQTSTPRYRRKSQNSWYRVP